MSSDKRILSLADRNLVEEYYRETKSYTFYHNFPLLLAISSSADRPFEVETSKEGSLLLWTSPRELYYPPRRISSLEEIDKVWISRDRPPNYYKFVEYDVNYIYDLKTIFSLDNFEHNVKRFGRDNLGSSITLVNNINKSEIWDMLRAWYQINLSATHSDFGYTIWLVNHIKDFPDLRMKVLRIGDDLVGLSIWGELQNNYAVFLVCKTLLSKFKMYFSHDYLRSLIYQDMWDEGFRFVNDGGDLGLAGLKKYKEKFRPIEVLPIYSWVRV